MFFIGGFLCIKRFYLTDLSYLFGRNNWDYGLYKLIELGPLGTDCKEQVLWEHE